MMPVAVTTAMVSCSFGASPSTLKGTTNAIVLVQGRPSCTISDGSNVNIGSFGMCSSLANPQVAAATTAAMGVLTPQPCTPMLSGNWISGKMATASTPVLVGGIPCLTMGSTCNCAYGGILTILNPAQYNVITG